MPEAPRRRLHIWQGFRMPRISRGRCVERWGRRLASCWLGGRARTCECRRSINPRCQPLSSRPASSQFVHDESARGRYDEWSGLFETQGSEMEIVLIDAFAVPEESKPALLETSRAVQNVLKTLPGFVEGFVYEKR